MPFVDNGAFDLTAEERGYGDGVPRSSPDRLDIALAVALIVLAAVLAGTLMYVAVMGVVP